jgi:two-component system, NarL family, response regulator LiaR
LRTVLTGFAGFTVVAETGDGDYAVSLCQQFLPDVVLMDVQMPRMSGIEATRRIRAACPQTQVIALTSFSDEANIQAMLKAGAISYLLKNISFNELAIAVHHAHRHKATLAPEVVGIMLDSLYGEPVPGHDLTIREHEVLLLMTEGLHNRENGIRLHIANSTVKNHISSILRKLGCTSRMQAVALAVAHNIQAHEAFE